MPTTPNYAIRYPVLGDAPNVPLDLQRLATDTDTALADVAASVAQVQADLDTRPKIKVGTADISLSNSGSGTVSVDISSAGFTAPPSISVISTNYSYYGYRAAGGTNDANTMTIGVRHFDNTSASTTVTVYYIVVGF